MKLTDFLQDVGRPVAYYPKLRRITGSTNATILLCQFIYWRGKESAADGWLYKESEEIEQETGLSYDEQKTARRKLIEAGLMEEHYARLDHQMKFRLILEAIDEQWGEGQSPIPEHGITAFGKVALPFSLSSNTESTTENDASASKPDILDGEIHFNLAPATIRQAIKEYFKMNVNWDTKMARQWMEWAVGENVTPDQIRHAAETWRSSKTFNWQVPTLKGIFEKWPMLMDATNDQQHDKSFGL